MSTNLLIQRGTRAWQLQVRVSFVIAVFLCGAARVHQRAYSVVSYAWGQR